MKKIIAALLLMAAIMPAFAQEKKEEQKEMKKGWSFGVLPTATYSRDNGFQAGAFGDVYYYGDGSTYPDPLHKISWEGSYFTNSHRMRFYLAYDSKYLIPNMRVNASVTYVGDPLYSFWGFNGPASVQNYDVWSSRKITLDNGKNVNYYGMSRDMLRVLANFQGQIIPHLNWAAGVNFWWWRMGSMRDNGVTINKQTKEKSYYDTDLTLFETYKGLGLIKESEKNGGLALELNAGVVYDTRDIEAAPNRGIWAEAYLNGNVLQHQYLKACLYFRHYIDIPIHIPAGDPVFAYRLAWQQTIAGETPFYMIQNVPLLVQRNMISEGFGSSNTIRGIRENRILSEGFAWANLELRVKLVNFKLFNQFFYIALNPFFDAGIITKAYRAAEINKVAQDGKLYDLKLAYPAVAQETLIYDASNIGKVIMSAGAGLKIAMNQNFIISAELAKCLYKPLDAGLWIGIGINYQF
ncbi:MAG: hypothetical protein IJV63_02375 [Bacteroidales bacterium]|nr:hypothetical protein [Bacteroidales bacterium]MBQ9701817.1 hypothetical protein [Bacteroidales bacterium]